MSVHDTVLNILALTGSVPVEALRQRAAIHLERSLPAAELQAAIASLQERGLVRRGAGGRGSLDEPNCLERRLYPFVQAYLESPEFREVMGLVASPHVLHDSSTDGRRSLGLWSAPDFTMAAVRQFTYDPLRYLDVLTFEVKNRTGTNVPAIHETHAHGRFAHLPHLVCPRSTRPASGFDEELRSECAAMGVGLIQFDLALDDGAKLLVGGFRLELAATRQSPSPSRTQRFLEDRLPTDKLEQLRRHAVAAR